MAPTSASLKVHTGHGNRRTGSNARTNGQDGGVGDSEDTTHFEHHLNGGGTNSRQHRASSGDPRHRSRRGYHHNHRRYDNLGVDDDGPAGIAIPYPVRESSEVSTFIVLRCKGNPSHLLNSKDGILI